MNKMEIVVEVIDGRDNKHNITVCECDYQPGDIDSMRCALDYTANQIEQIAEYIRGVSRTNIKFRRADGTVINEVDSSHIETANQVIKLMCEV